MDARELKKLDRELDEFVGDLFHGMGRRERLEAMSAYVEGLLLDGARKNIEAMARRLVSDESKVEAKRQRMQECVTRATWVDEEMNRRLSLKMQRELPGAEALILDDTGFPKKGKHSVGVQRQYSGSLGRVDNCQVATSLHLASERGSCCIGMRLYLPQEWADDFPRRAKAGVPDDVVFQKKWEIALDQLDAAEGWGVPNHVVLGDAAFGDVTEFRVALEDRDRSYMLGAASTLKVWAPGMGPIPPEDQPKSKRGRPRTKHKTGDVEPMTLLELALAAGECNLQTLTWREGSKGPQRSRFAAARVRTAHRHASGQAPGREVWCVWAWPPGAEKPNKFWLSNLPATTSLRRLVYLAKLRWRVERDYQEMKGELGLDHYEGRTWRGFHHHCTLVSLAHAFLTLQRVLSPPILRDEMDDPRGPPASAARPDPETRPMPPLRAGGEFARSADETLPNLIR